MKRLMFPLCGVLAVLLTMPAYGVMFKFNPGFGGYAGPVKFVADVGAVAGTTYPAGTGPVGGPPGVAGNFAAVDAVTGGTGSTAPGALGDGSGFVEDAWDIFRVGSILSLTGGTVGGVPVPANTIIWDPTGGLGGPATQEITGLAYGFVDSYVEIAANGFGEVEAGGLPIGFGGVPGGHIDFYIDDSPDFDLTGGPLARVGPASYPTVTNGTLFLSTTAETSDRPAGHPAFGGTFSGGGAYGSILHNAVTNTSPFTSADTIFSITATTPGGTGAQNAMFNNNAVITPANGFITDFRVDVNVGLLADPAARATVHGWTLDFLTGSQSTAVVPPVPEPSSLLLIGVGLGFLSMLQYRRRSKKQS